ncbi:MAG TPA: hypothetical protein VNV86_22905 [Candidatus Acidoferrum sp.]|nr:hypothetical protein [Candidatus Acidoferrum sp.]
MTAPGAQVLLSTSEKALQINLDAKRFGTFAEIGAGQEVARWFFHAGKASATVAKSISAYDMAVSDEIYGKTGRYVSRQRLQSMLEREFEQLQKRLIEKPGMPGAPFVLADTVATHSHGRHNGGQGWMGVRFHRSPGDASPGEPPSEIIIHIKMLDAETVAEQEAVGIVGVNLAYGAFYLHEDPKALTMGLMDGLSRRRIEIDMIRFDGPAFAGVDNRLMSLELVESALTDAVMFTAEGEVVQPSEVLYGRPVLVERGSFRPITNVTLDMLVRSEEQLQRERPGPWEPPVVVMEMTLHNLSADLKIDHADFLARVDMLGALGKIVMISNYTTFDRVTGYLRGSTQNWIALVVGLPTLQEIVRKKYYVHLDGGLLEGLGRLFQGPVTMMVYPTRATATGEISTVEDLEVQPENRSLYAHLLQNGLLQGIRDFAADQLHVTPGEVLSKLQAGDPAWESMVPAEVALFIKTHGLFGCKGAPPLDVAAT